MPELRIYDDIGYGAVTAAWVADQLEKLSAAAHIDIRINSTGGSVFDGVAIHNAIARHPAKTTVHIDGLAGSAASFIAMAGDEIVINRYAKMMIHDASGISVGNAADMGAAMAMLDQLSHTIAQMYADRAGGTPEQWRRAMLAETWYSADAAVKAGLADRVDTEPAQGRVSNATPAPLQRAVAVAAARRQRRTLTNQKG
ncbi:head maturation protease, ClpP-related [Mycolicibacterium sp. HS_4_1]